MANAQSSLLCINRCASKSFNANMLVQEHKDKTITHMVDEVLTWFNQLCLHPRKRENLFTIQQKTLHKIKPDIIIGFLKHPMFPHSLYPHLEPRVLLLHKVSPIFPYISIHLVLSLQAHLHLMIFSSHDLEYVQRYFQQLSLFQKEV